MNKNKENEKYFDLLESRGSKKKKKRKKGKYEQGVIKLLSETHKKKYQGDPNCIIYRSSWEKDFLFLLLKHKRVTKLSSEEVVIPYIKPTDGKPHRYFMDFAFEIITTKNKVKSYLVEVKPFVQTQPPKKTIITKRHKKPKSYYERKYLNDLMTYEINMAKWEAANEYVKKKGYSGFMILTENPERPNRYKLWKYEEITCY